MPPVCNVGVDVGLHHADAELVLERGDGAAERGGLAAAGGAHQVEQKDLVFFQFGAQLVSLAVVAFKYTLLDLQNAEAFHGDPSSKSLLITSCILSRIGCFFKMRKTE